MDLIYNFSSEDFKCIKSKENLPDFDNKNFYE